MEVSPSGAKKARKEEDRLHQGHPVQVAAMKAWRSYWAAMPPSPVYPQTCCLCGAAMTGRRYLCEGCGD